MSAIYIPIDAPRVGAMPAGAAAKEIGNVLEGEFLMLLTNRDCNQLHIIHPDLSGRRPGLRRMVVHKGEKHRTVVERIANMWDDYGRKGVPLVNAMQAAFDVEPVTRAFLADYKRVFENAKCKITGFANDERRHLFTQTLFNRLMFIHFVQRKGWLSYDGDTDYLKALWQSYRNDGGSPKNFYADRLRLLFFGGLNNYRSEDVTDGPEAERLIGQVPFLNGGLFEESEVEKGWSGRVPDDVIEAARAELFEKYNFTVMESTPFDQEVAVDPEMLGKVFEELVTGRHESGSYYTPREVVAFMCREALNGYLAGKVEGLSEENIAQFVDDRDPSAVHIHLASQVAIALNEVTVVDPACGSGAYLLRMMQELVELQTILFTAARTEESQYALKRNIISRNLYGADKDEFAVNIAMLRLWLSLAIEYEGETPEPLPNLEFKVVHGDSLICPSPSGENYGDLFRHQARAVAGQLVDLKSKHMVANGPEKEDLRRRIAAVQDELRDALEDSEATEGGVDWRIEFAEVFARGGGFDIALANPPYVVVKDKNLRELYKEGVYGRMNLYGLFIQRALELTSKGGQIFFINPRTVLTDR